jgi:hypothetical protein
MATKFEISSFLGDERLVARRAAAGDVFSFLTRSLVLPPDCAAMVWPEVGSPRVVGPGSMIEADGAVRVMFVRRSPFTLGYNFDRLSTADGFELSASVGLQVRVVAERTELAGFCDRLMGSAATVTLDALQSHCAEAVHAAVVAFAKARNAADLLSPQTWPEFDAILEDSFKPVGFASGLELLGDVRITTASKDFARAAEAQRVQKLRADRIAAEQQLRELSSDARRQRLTELADTLDRLQEMAEKNKGSSLVELIRAFDPLQRGGLYQALLARQGGASQSHAILIVAGDELLWFDPASPGKPTRRLSLASDAGPLRSVHASSWEGKSVVLVGAKRGVHLLRTEQDPRLTFMFDVDRPLRGGVNAAAVIGERLLATHSEVGLIEWALRKTDHFDLPRAELFITAKSVRDLRTDDKGTAWMAVDRRVVGIGAEAEAEPIVMNAPASVTAMTLAGGWVYGGLESGQIVAWRMDSPEIMDSLRPACGNAVESIGFLEGGGVPRLLIADRRPHLEMMIPGESVSTKYAAGQAMRWGLSAGPWIAGINDRRDQLVIWGIEDPAEPTAVISIGQLCGHSVQDAACLTASAI